MSPYGLRTGTFTATITTSPQANRATGRCPLAGCQMKIDISFESINHSLALQSQRCNRPSAAKWAVKPLIGMYRCGVKDRRWNDYADGGVLEQSEVIFFFLFPDAMIVDSAAALG